MTHKFAERADPNIKGYEAGTRRWFNVIDRYQWANQRVSGIVLDVPCGTGWGAMFLTNAEILVGVDNSSEAIKRGCELNPNITYILANMLCMPFEDNFADSVVCCEGYEHVERKDQFILMNELYRVVKPKGIVLMAVPILNGKHSGNPYHLHEPTIHEVEETIHGKFKVVHFTKPNVARYVLRPIK